MVFSSPIFIFFFLPVVLGLYFLSRRAAHNYILLAASLLFYFWGEGKYTLVMLASILMNHLFGLLLSRTPSRQRQRALLTTAIVLNVGLLFVFKYANFATDITNYFLRAAGLPTISIPYIPLPIGISFFTFQALSYVIDIYRGDVKAQPKLSITMLYISLFPHLIAGPIVRYSSIASELVDRTVNRENFAEGVRRFVVGLSKKMLIANSVAVAADQIFALPSEQLSLAVAWLGVLCYTLQIYFDFAGYSDMAIGLALMFGFHFPENFDYPYMAQSVREFWRRWHISLSTWFRDYVYIPLGGNRVSTGRTYLNLGIVYLLTGLWHGASWTFVVWGLYHGFFMIIERLGLDAWLSKQHRWIRHLYLLLVVMIGWVFFRAESITSAWRFLGAMFGQATGNSMAYGLSMYLSPGLVVIILLGVLAAGPIQHLQKVWQREVAGAPQEGMFANALMQSLGHVMLLSLLFFLSLMQLAADTYNPFIYFRF
jgi:alginate O-acetyltransferase complex protein AlgI